MKVMICAGGTGGHVYPALAVAAVLRRRGHEVVWMGAPNSFEARVVPAQGIALEPVRVKGLHCSASARRWCSAWAASPPAPGVWRQDCAARRW